MHRNPYQFAGHVVLPVVLCFIVATIYSAEPAHTKQIKPSLRVQDRAVKIAQAPGWLRHKLASPLFPENQAYGEDQSADDRSTGADDYLQDVAGDGIFHWPAGKFPLKVYIESAPGVPGYKPYFNDILRHAFNEWVQASHGRLGWREVSNKAEADIVCSWTDHVTERTEGTEAARTRTFTRFNTETNTGTISRATMLFLTRLPERQFSSSEVTRTCLHEVGHVFGIAGHSPDRGDVMYAAVPRNSYPHLSMRDEATMNRLYDGYPQVNSIVRASPRTSIPRT